MLLSMLRLVGGLLVVVLVVLYVRVDFFVLSLLYLNSQFVQYLRWQQRGTAEAARRGAVHRRLNDRHA